MNKQEDIKIFSSVKILKTGEAGVVTDIFTENGKLRYKVEVERMRVSSYQRVSHVYYRDEIENLNEWFPKKEGDLV